jgi:hypothetical protein
VDERRNNAYQLIRGGADPTVLERGGHPATRKSVVSGSAGAAERANAGFADRV